MKPDVILQLQPLWDRFADVGFSEELHSAAAFYPMPGSADFDDDDRFLALPLFPADYDARPTLVRDDRWELPVAWLRQYETRPRSARTFMLGIPIKQSSTAVERAAGLFVRRAAYLEMFRSRRPYSLATMRHNVQFCLAIAVHAISINKLVASLDYDDLLEVVSTVPKAVRRRAAMVHDMMRWWRGISPETFSGYTPPPSLASIPIGDEPRKGFNAQHIRKDESPEPDRRFQPLPDDFVAKMGEFMIWVNNVLRPIHHEFLQELAVFGPSPTQKEIQAAASSQLWPEGYGVNDVPSAVRIGNMCQSSAFFLISLLLGPRWSEVCAIPRQCLKEMPDGSFLLDGSTFKFSRNLSGEMRDWPVHPELARALRQQQHYIDLTEAADFPFLWRSHSTIFASGEPVRQSGTILDKMVLNAGCKNLLEGTSFHHHRFRKTTARLIVIALHGGPLVLRRLFGHQHLGVTLRYILANASIVEELRTIAEEEQRQSAAKFVDRRSELRGGGAAAFNASVGRIASLPDISVPDGKRDQNAITTDDILDILADQTAEGLSLKQIVPGLIACFKPAEQAGLCCKVGELPNVSKCAMACQWHLGMPEYVENARPHLVSALSALRTATPGSLHWIFYSDIARSKMTSFPELGREFSEDPIARQVLESLS